MKHPPQLTAIHDIRRTYVELIQEIRCGIAPIRTGVVDVAEAILIGLLPERAIRRAPDLHPCYRVFHADIELILEDEYHLDLLVVRVAETRVDRLCPARSIIGTPELRTDC